jgi:hypothetical protein
MDILKYIEWEMTHYERMLRHRRNMDRVQLALAYSQSVEGIPLRTFGEVQFVSLN